MTSQNGRTPINAMGFYHANGLVPAWNQAMRFAGEGGRIATLPDIVNARIATDPETSVPWNTYFTTSTAEYMGIGRSGRKILIVAHGVGPMATLEGILQVYSHEYKDKTRSRRGGRITQEEFWKLEDGFYGEVGIVELASMELWYQYPFLEFLKANQAINDLLLQHRLGPRGREYITYHMKAARQFHRLEHGKDIENPYILRMGDASNCGYMYYPLEDGMAFAHVVSVSSLMNVSHQSEYRCPSMACDIDLHEWWNGTRLCGVRANGQITDIHPGISPHDCIRQHWTSLLRPTQLKTSTRSFSALMKIGEDWFAQYPKKGEGLDTHAPEFKVTSIAPVGELVTLRTTVGGYHGLFRYGVKEIKAIAPPEANAYSVEGDISIVWTDGNPTHHEVAVQFYKVDVDTSQRIIHPDTLANDFDLLMRFV
jgi:hypothetical protein